MLLLAAGAVRAQQPLTPAQIEAQREAQRERPTDRPPDRMQRLTLPPPPGAHPTPGAPAPASTLPANPPTALPAANALPSPIAATPVPATDRPHRAQITFAAGQLEVRADDSSLHQILRAIARQTGMTISGGVTDQRIFGNYGPAQPATILATLLDGTGVNMLLKESAGDTPLELYLTPRTPGGPTPPSIPTDADNAPDLAPAVYPAAAPGPAALLSPTPQPAPTGSPTMPPPLNNVNGSSNNTDPTASTFPTINSVPTSSLPQPYTTPSSSGIVDAPNPPPPGSTTAPNPGGVATPEQIYQQLLQLQQKQKQGAASGAP